MDWVWPLYEKYIRKELARLGHEEPDDAMLEETFYRVLNESILTLLVQEPWRGSVRFKTLARFESDTMMDLLSEPMAYLRDRFGGGKFKVNFHHGYHFIATRNFKPEGEPLWMDFPELAT